MKINYAYLMFWLSIATLIGTNFMLISSLFTSNITVTSGLELQGVLTQMYYSNCTQATMTIINYDKNSGDNHLRFSCSQQERGINLWVNSTK